MIDANYYLHDSDRKALQALQAIPGFTQLFKAFMKVWSEKQFRIQNLSSHLRINDKQLSRYYEMLPPICEKLGIEIPELYLKLDDVAKSYTAGDTRPFIVITSGLLETLPDELIPTVLARECGHIACHHCLYSTMGRFILSDAIGYLGLNNLAVVPIQVAFSYWMRCSELSADRAAVICDGGSEKVVEMCMRFAGLSKDVIGEVSVDEFLNQAKEYLEMVQDSKWDKTLEFVMLSNMDHPLNAVRAYEASSWSKDDHFVKIMDYVSAKLLDDSADIKQYLPEVPMKVGSKFYAGKSLSEVESLLLNIGFTNIQAVKSVQKGVLLKDGQVLSVAINGKNNFNMGEWYPLDAEVIIEYYEAEMIEDKFTDHLGQLKVPESSKKLIGKLYKDMSNLFDKY